MPVAENSNTFLASGGEMGAMMRAHDWSMSPVGPPEDWPQLLRSVVGLMLANKHIMFVAWGPELAFLYNDAYRPVFGAKHPWALGRPFKEIWSEVWDEVEPLVDAALGGEATWSENLHLVLNRNGYPEDCWFTFSYSPIRDETGAVVGLFCAATETTGKILAERQLRSQVERQRRLFEKAPGFIAILTGPDHTFEFVNEAYVQLVGPRDFVGRTVRQVFPDLDRQGFFELLDGVFVSGERFVAERVPIALQVSPDQPGRDAVLDFVYEPMRDEGGNVTGVFIEGHDVTEAHLAQTALQESQARQAFILRLSDVLRAEPSAEAIAERALKMLFEEMRLDRCYVGIYQVAEDRGDFPHQVHHDDLPPLPVQVRLSDFPKALQVAFEQTLVIEDVARMKGLSDTDKSSFSGLGMGALVAATLRKGENNPFWAIVAVSNAPRLWTQGEIFLVEEVAERTWAAVQHARAEAALRDSEARLSDFNQLLETRITERTAERDRLWQLSPDLLTVVDYEGRLLRVNPSWSRALGYDEEHLLTRPYAELLHPDESDAISKVLDEMKAQERSVLLEHRLLAANGAWRSFISTLSPDPGGKRFYGVGRDVTDEKARAAELEAAQEHLRQSQKLEALGQLTGGVAHDFNNLLTPVIVGLELLQRSHDDPRSQMLIGGALQSAERAKTLIQRLLTFARRQALDPRPVDLAMLLENMRDLLDRSLGPLIKVIVGVADDLPAAMIDPNQLELAILNLVVNARDAMPNGGVLNIDIGVEAFIETHKRNLAPGKYVRIAITDNGTGMDAETLARCTEPFFSTKEIGQGTGLGLAMVHGLAAQSGGEFKLSSQLGVGTQALLWIPTTERTVVSNTSRLPNPPKVRLPATLLLVEDEDHVRSSTAEGLRAQGLDVVEASSAAEALDIVASGIQLHLVITDHMMPNMTGSQLVAELRKVAPSLPVLMITGYASMTPGQTDGLEILAKPFGLTDLAARVALLLELAPSATPALRENNVVT